MRTALQERGESVPNQVGKAHPAPDDNLPSSTTIFVGRAAELSQLEDLLHQPECRLLTLTGPGGSGKTRLALALAQRLWQNAPENFPDGVFFVPLASIETPDGLWAALAAALGLELQPRLSPAAQVKRFLQPRRALLVLDNLEQLEAHSGELVNLLNESAGLKLLVTSRLALGLYEEWLFEVGGLAMDDTPDNDAAQLFAQTARRARLRFNLAAEWPHVQVICRLVGGLPLGIELAAAWVRSLPVREIAALVKRSQAQPASPLRNLADRHTSLGRSFRPRGVYWNPMSSASWRGWQSSRRRLTWLRRRGSHLPRRACFRGW